MSRPFSYVLAANVMVLLAACGNEPSGGAEAACAAPQTLLQASVAAPGQAVFVAGAGFLRDCRDRGDGVSRSLPGDLPVRFMQGQSVAEVGVARAGAGGVVPAVSVVIPAYATPGPATFALGDGAPAQVTITGSR